MLISQYHSITVENDGNYKKAALNCHDSNANNAVIALVVKIGFVFVTQNVISRVLYNNNNNTRPKLESIFCIKKIKPTFGPLSLLLF